VRSDREAGEPSRAGRRAVVLAAGYVAGAVPFAQIGAARRRGIDLRRVGSGTVSGTGLYRVAGFRALAAYGVLEVAKGAVGPALAARREGRTSALAAATAGAAVIGHNWSPFLRGAGGRGVAPLGAAVLATGLGVGKWAGETAIGCAVADAALLPVLRRAGGSPQARVGAAVLVPIVVKRLVGNGPPQRRSLHVYLLRLLLDRDAWVEA
jgi:acyl phosphate:glycerol-3-phosphate acyltransferase